VTTATTTAAAGSAPTYEFDAGFQTKVAALTILDGAFMQRVEGLIDPAHFESVAEGVLVDIGLDYYDRYGTTPSRAIFVKLLKDRIADGRVRKELVDDVKAALGSIWKSDLSDGEYVADEVAKFARSQAYAQAMIKAIDLHAKRDFEGIRRIMGEAELVGLNEEGQFTDYWGDIDLRTQRRKDEVAGIKPSKGIPSGVPELDKFLYYKGFERQGLTVLMGAPKSGKSTGLGEVAKGMSLLGYNCLYVSLEVSDEIIADRLDANVTSTDMTEITSHIMDIDGKIKAVRGKAGKLMIHRYPASTFKPSDLKRLIRRYRAKGIKFDAVFPDYLDIMAPDHKESEKRDESKNTWTSVRDIAITEDLAMISATALNREGSKASVGRATDVAEDINKIRIADLVISINATEEEKMRGEARLFFAASRNQRDEFTVRIKQDRSKMKWLTAVLGVE
tara:strand:+ start:4282 stop:5625 length:1344 start_codon:yes stop_codon:yes gene_type:complete